MSLFYGLGSVPCPWLRIIIIAVAIIVIAAAVIVIAAAAIIIIAAAAVDFFVVFGGGCPQVVIDTLYDTSHFQKCVLIEINHEST
jgi:hypothetical protein